jgi:hypothetical protein
MADLTSNQVRNICCIHYNAGLRCCALGSLVEGGYLFNKSGGMAWIVACSSTEVSRNWASISDAVTVAQAGNACGDWFVPSKIALQLGQECKSFWDSSSTYDYWSSTSVGATPFAAYVRFYDGYTNFGTKSSNRNVRAFRRVYY